MLTPGIGRLLLTSIICFGITACSANIAAFVPATPTTPVPAKAPPTTLTGNWFITDSRIPATYPTPLTANLTITNSPCAISTSTTGLPEPSFIDGDSFDIFFPVPQPPAGFLRGTLNDLNARSFFGDLTSLTTNSACSGIAFYTFTKQ